MMIKHFEVCDKDRSLTDAARFQKIHITPGNIQGFLHLWDTTLLRMQTVPGQNELLHQLQMRLDMDLDKNHEFNMEYSTWYHLEMEDPKRTYEKLHQLMHDWVRRRNELSIRRQNLKENTNTGFFQDKAGKGKGGDAATQICFAWRDRGQCAKKDSGDCPYDHPLKQKGKGKGNGSKTKTDKRRGRGNNPRSPSRNRSPSASGDGKKGKRGAKGGQLTDPHLSAEK